MWQIAPADIVPESWAQLLQLLISYRMHWKGGNLRCHDLWLVSLPKALFCSY